MINIDDILPKEISPKSLFSYAIIVLGTASILFLATVISPQKVKASDTVSDSHLLIPEATLDLAFNIPSNLEESFTFQIPVDFTYLSQGFSVFHPGVDLPSQYASPVRPISPGTVEEVGYSVFGYGNVVLINHGNGIESLYAHLSKIEVKKGDKVSLNTQIGLVGSTGHSTGPHLHLEIHKNGTPINPLSFLPSLKNAPLKLLSSK